MRTFIIAALIVLLAFSVPHAVFAQTGTDCSITFSCPSGYNCDNQQTCQPNTGSVGSGTVSGGSVGSGTVAPGTTLYNPLKSGTSLSSFLSNIMDFVINIGGIIVVLMLVFVGYKFVVAQGAPSAIEEAKKMLLWTVIGALVLLGAKAISAGIMATVQALGG